MFRTFSKNLGENTGNMRMFEDMLEGEIRNRKCLL